MFIFSTGNYNAVTAHLYTDSNADSGRRDSRPIGDLFNYLTGLLAKSDYRKLLVARSICARVWRNSSSGKSSHAGKARAGS